MSELSTNLKIHFRNSEPKPIHGVDPSVALPSLDDMSPEDLQMYRRQPEECFIIRYRDVSGRDSLRRVAVRGWKKDVVACWCFERRAMRTFRLDRILTAFDMFGEELNPSPFLPTESPADIVIDAEELVPIIQAAFSAANEEAERRAHVMAELAILRSLALADGRARKVENDLIANWLIEKMYGGKVQQLDAGTVAKTRKWIATFYPPEDMAEDVAAQIARRSESEIIELLRFCRDLIKVDGVVDSEEVRKFATFGELLLSACNSQAE